MSPIRKRMVTAVKHPEMEGVIRVYVKGAPEYLLPKCTRTFKENGSRDQLGISELDYIQKDILTKLFTSQGHRAIMFAYKDVEEKQFQDMKQDYNNFLTDQDKDALESDLCFVGLFAL